MLLMEPSYLITVGVKAGLVAIKGKSLEITDI